jgi:HD-GYP domain-containing protein (c-di-GMP phosphodiesterase class II)
MPDARPEVSWPELMAAVSLAADAGMALPRESGLATCLVAIQIGERLGLAEDVLQRTYHLAMLQHIGCTTGSALVADIMGDELLMRQHASTLDFSDQRAMFGFMLGHVGRANPLAARPLALVRAMAGGKRILESANEVCEAAQLLGGRLGYDPSCLSDLAVVYEHWDGSGFPNGVAGEDITTPVQVVQVASLAVNAERLMGSDAAGALVRVRRGHTLSPAVTDAMLGDPTGVLAPLHATDSLWDAVIAAEPMPSPPPDSDQVDALLSALADFADLKSPYHLGHSSGVAALAADAARVLGLSDPAVTRVRRAGWVHDLGRIAVSSAIWGSTRPLRPDEREQVHMHPYHTSQVLGLTPFLRSLDEVASAHHERLDGSGYFRGLPGPALSVPARVLAAADAFHGKVEARPHRAALSQTEAATYLRSEADSGRLDPTAVDAVLTAAGQPSIRTHEQRLTPREVEIMVQVARGGTMREIARALSIAPKTVDGHLQRIYPKIGASTRAGATLYAMQHGLLSPLRKRENSP